MQPDLPTRCWEMLGSDIFQFNGANYLIIVDYYSRFPIIRPLNDTSASTISSHLTSLFAEYGLPSALTTDFGSQFVSEMFKKKCEESVITLTFSSPYHHQANSVAERCVGNTKSQGTLPTMLIEKPTSRSKPSQQNFTKRESAATSVFLKALSQCSYGTLESTSGNRAGQKLVKHQIKTALHQLIKTKMRK